MSDINFPRFLKRCHEPESVIDQLKKDQQALRDQILSLKKRVHALENKGEVD